MPDSDSGKVALAAFDTLVWQAFASVIVPGSLSNQIVDNVLSTEYRQPVKVKLYNISGFLINRICAGSLVGLARLMPSVAENTRKWATTGIGLGVIPFIVHPIDSLVHLVMDNTTRQGPAGIKTLNDAQQLSSVL